MPINISGYLLLAIPRETEYSLDFLSFILLNMIIFSEFQTDDSHTVFRWNYRGITVFL